MNYTLSSGETIGIVLLVLWELTWKGLAMWRAAKLHAPYWFGALLIINSVGVFPILYLIFTTDQHKAVA